MTSTRSVVIVPSWALEPRGRPARWCASRPCSRITRRTRRRLVRIPAKRSRAHSLRWPSPWKGLAVRSFLISPTKSSSNIAPSGPGLLGAVSVRSVPMAVDGRARHAPQARDPLEAVDLVRGGRDLPALMTSASGGPKGAAPPDARSSPPGARPSSSARRPWPAAGRSRRPVRPPGGSSAMPRPGQELVTPAAQLGRGHSQLARDQLQILAPQEPQHRLLLAARRHPPPRLGRGPVSASVVGALHRAHAHPCSLVHPPPPCSCLPAKRCLSEL